MSHVITELKSVWPDLIIVYGEARHPQSQGSVESANGHLRDVIMVWHWLAENNTEDLAVGFKFVLF